MAKHLIVAFDFDGTLVDSRAAIIASMQEAFRQAALAEPTPETILSMMGVRVEESFPILTGGKLTEAQVQRLVESYREIYGVRSKDLISLYPGIADLLRAMREAQIRVGVVTSKIGTAAMQDAQHLGIAEFIEHVIGAKEVTNAKPHPEPLQRFCRFFGRYPDPTTLMIGDATFDIEMGNRAGAASCAVLWGAHSEEKLRGASPTYVVKNVEELVAIL